MMTALGQLPRRLAAGQTTTDNEYVAHHSGSLRLRCRPLRDNLLYRTALLRLTITIHGGRRSRRAFLCCRFLCCGFLRRRFLRGFLRCFLRCRLAWRLRLIAVRRRSLASVRATLPTAGICYFLTARAPFCRRGHADSRRIERTVFIHRVFVHAHLAAQVLAARLVTLLYEILRVAIRAR